MKTVCFSWTLWLLWFSFSATSVHAFATIGRRSRNAGCESRTAFLLGATAPGQGGSERADGGTSNDDDLDYLKSELGRYLERRKEVGADDIARQEVGKRVGGTRGNALLEYVSFAPNRGSTVDEVPNMFDYSELQRYGFGHLATPIMQSGGRLAMYDLMGLERPPTSSSPSSKAPSSSSEPLVIDRTGRNDAGRYKGLKLGILLDDNLQAQAVRDAERRAQLGEVVGRPRLVEEDYERPFADLASQKRNRGGGDRGYWTAEKLDEYGKMRGRVISEARRADADKIVPDRMEVLENLDLSQRLYAICTALLVSVAFGRSTPVFFAQILHYAGSSTDIPILDVAKVPAAALVLASVGASAYCAIQAPQKRRNSLVWSIKGLLGGPVSIRQLRDLPSLVTRRERDEDEARRREVSS